MNDEFFATIKLITGEEILAYIETHDEGIIVMNPLLLEDMSVFEDLFDNIQARGMKLSKWIKSSTDDIFFIKDSKIVTISELIEPALTHYKNALTEIENTEKKIISKKRKKYNGHKSTVKEARIKFEKLFNDY